jgi:hypothetical protein
MALTLQVMDALTLPCETVVVYGVIATSQLAELDAAKALHEYTAVQPTQAAAV